MNEELGGFIAAAKAKGASAEDIYWLLQAKGWTNREIRQAGLLTFETETGLSVPSRRQRAESAPLDGFLYGLSSLILIYLVTNFLTLTHVLIQRQVQTRADWNTGPDAMIYAIGGIIVVCPVYLVLMSINHRRIAKGITPKNSNVRSWVLAVTLLIGSIAILGYLLAAVTGLLSGDQLPAALAKSGIPILILAAFTFYYYQLLRVGQEAN